MSDPLPIPRPIINAIRTIPGVRDIDTSYGGCYATTPTFYIRVLEVPKGDPSLYQGERKWDIQLAYRKTFDRWANSTNFTTQVWWDPKKNQRFSLDSAKRCPQYTIPDMKREVEWCRKVAQSGLFEWNSYFATIKTPWFINPRKVYSK